MNENWGDGWTGGEETHVSHRDSFDVHLGWTRSGTFGGQTKDYITKAKKEKPFQYMYINISVNQNEENDSF